jgi:hypothetical protein
MMRKTTQFLFVVLLAAASGLTGCNSGPDLGAVTGKITLDGQPAEGLEVEFEPKQAGAASAIGYTQADGTYELYYPGNHRGAAPGEYIVRIRGSETDDPAEQKVVAPRYNMESELSATVTSGANTFNFDVESQ